MIDCLFFLSLFSNSFIVLGTLASVFTLSNILRLYLSNDDAGIGGDSQFELSLTQLIEQHPLDYRWALKFVINCFGYSCIFVPGILIYQYTKKVKYLERCGKWKKVIILVVVSGGGGGLNLTENWVNCQWEKTEK